MALPPPDRFDRSADSPSSPARDAFLVIPHDTVALPRLPKALLIGVAGALTLRAVDGTADVSFAVTAGQIVPIRAAFVRSSGTSASQIVGLA